MTSNISASSTSFCALVFAFGGSFFFDMLGIVACRWPYLVEAGLPTQSRQPTKQ
jgi:hypothetical protein